VIRDPLQRAVGEDQVEGLALSARRSLAIIEGFSETSIFSAASPGQVSFRPELGL